MPSEEGRKIVSVGNSLAVTLPMPYVRYHGLKPSDDVIVFYDGLILIAPKHSIAKTKERRKLIDELLR